MKRKMNFVLAFLIGFFVVMPSVNAKTTVNEQEYDNLEDAIKVYSVITKQSDNPEVFVNLAVAQSQLKNYPEALATLDNAKNKFPKNTQIADAIKNISAQDTASKFDRAAEFFNNKDYQNAINEYAKINPPTSDSMLGIASSYQNMENRDKAIEYYKKALELKPADSDIAYYIGVMYAEGEDLESAQEYLKKAVALNKNNQKASEYLASIESQISTNSLNEAISLYDAGNYDESLNLLNKLIIKDPMNAYAYYYRGMIYDTKGNKTDAVNSFKAALKYNNSDELNILNYLIAVDLDSMEKYKEASEYYQKYSASNAPDDEYKQYAATRLEELKPYVK